MSLSISLISGHYVKDIMHPICWRAQDCLRELYLALFPKWEISFLDIFTILFPRWNLHGEGMAIGPYPALLSPLSTVYWDLIWAYRAPHWAGFVSILITCFFFLQFFERVLGEGSSLWEMYSSCSKSHNTTTQDNLHARRWRLKMIWMMPITQEQHLSSDKSKPDRSWR